ncbi:DUF1624 domain-containing protein [Burkholderia multivorans]|uniref:heparan-alpha-glucosaminide N-acetyltransferase domain-containing protein n=1 Tax=Burkholderia multivorans TaxID=87883 RepID=UPI001C211A5B|nr:heparan-alpha-glucosaminide N-acetyltransferase domain-containing protein [Burkholderia multivorans]MBU9675353.1 DUF1624 domain-containing protein [Burkholderia multivorans]
MPIRSLPAVPTTAGARLIAIDALRGLVMLLMLVDHVRETFFLHRQVSDPMDALTVDPALFFTRLTSQLCALGVAIVAGHNLLDGIRLEPDSAGFVPWAILHQRAFIDLWDGVRARTSYPVLPWIGVILLGYAAGPWFARGVAPGVRMRRLATVGVALVVAYVALRALNVYGDKPWIATGDALRTTMSFLAATKYPPSLMFLLPTLGATLLLLAAFERRDRCAVAQRLATLGGAPMFFYLLHLYVLKALYVVALATFGANQGNYFGFDALLGVWLASALLIVPLYWPAAWFARLKQRRKEVGWLKYL